MQRRLTIEQRLTALDRIDKGVSQHVVAQQCGVSTAAVSKWKKNRERSNIYYATKLNKGADVAKRVYFRQTSSFEPTLYDWFSEQRVKGIPISGRMLKDKALELHASVDSGTFKASDGWLEKFKRRFGIRQLNIVGESLSADQVAVDSFRKKFLEHLVEREGLSPHQIFNADESGLNYRCLPSRTSGGENEKSGPVEHKDRLTILVCCSAAGEKLPIAVVGKTSNPSAFNGLSKKNLPVVCYNSSKAWMTREIFTDWFHNHFEPFAMNSCRQKNLPPKVALLLDKAPSHVRNEDDLKCDGVIIEYLPPSVTSAMQPCEQGAIALMKRNYRKSVVFGMVGVPDLPSGLKRIDVRMAIDMLVAAWDEVPSAGISGCWHKLWPSLKTINITSNQRSLAPILMNTDAHIRALVTSDTIWRNIDEQSLNTWLEIDRDDDGNLHSAVPEPESDHQRNGSFKPYENHVRLGINPKEGVSVLDKAIMFLLQENRVSADVITALVKERDRVSKLQ